MKSTSCFLIKDVTQKFHITLFLSHLTDCKGVCGLFVYGKYSLIKLKDSIIKEEQRVNGYQVDNEQPLTCGSGLPLFSGIGLPLCVR